MIEVPTKIAARIRLGEDYDARILSELARVGSLPA